MFVVTAILAGLVYYSARTRASTNERVSRQIQQMTAYGDAQAQFARAATYLLSYYALHDPAYVDGFQDSQTRVATALGTAAQLAEADSPEDAVSARRLTAQNEEVAQTEEGVLAALEQSDVEKATLIVGVNDLTANAASLREGLDAQVERSRTEVALALAHDNAAQRRLVAVTLVVAVACGGLGLVLMLSVFVWLIRPLEKLRRASQAVASGDLTVRVPESGPRELAAVGADVNRMAGALILRSEQLNAYLERDLASRTLELERSRTSLERTEERIRRIAEHALVGIYELDAEFQAIYLNPAACEMLEVADMGEAHEYGFESFFTAESLETIRRERARQAVGGSTQFEVEVIGARGTLRNVLVSGAVVGQDLAEATLIGTMVDITERKLHEQVYRYAATHDPLTDAFNRRGLEEEINRQLEHHEKNGGTSALLFLDLDDFKAVNDAFGHAAGDRLLMGIARVLRAALREGDIVARVGGDEFAILLRDVHVRAAGHIVRRLLRTLGAHPVDIDGRVVEILCSVGLVMMPSQGRTPGELLARADIAMYEAKESGRNRVCMYKPGINGKKPPDDRLKWKHRIREALDTGGLTLYAQPIVDLRTGSVFRHELLLRMVGDRGRTLLPSTFLGIAENYGLISEIDTWVVREAIRILAVRTDAGEDVRFAVNLSARALDDRHLVRVVRSELARTGLDPRRLCFEITETAAIQDVDKAHRLISGLTQLGCEFALDDFGVGFSSFSRLKHLPIQELKIDGSFIQNVPTNPIDQHLVRAIVELARGLGIRVVAEFVQDATSVELLRKLGVDFGQGYHFGKPRRIDDVFASQHRLVA